MQANYASKILSGVYHLEAGFSKVRDPDSGQEQVASGILALNGSSQT